MAHSGLCCAIKCSGASLAYTCLCWNLSTLLTTLNKVLYISLISSKHKLSSSFLFKSFPYFLFLLSMLGSLLLLSSFSNFSLKHKVRLFVIFLIFVTERTPFLELVFAYSKNSGLLGAGEMALWLSILAALSEDLGLILDTFFGG